MAPVTRKRKAATTTAEAPAAVQRLTHPTSSTKVKSSRVDYKDDDPFYDIYADASDSGSDSEASDYTSRRRRKKMKVNVKKRKSGKKSPGPAPAAPEISDNEVGLTDEDSLWSNNSKAMRSSSSIATTPSVLSIKINGTTGSPTTLNLNLGELLSKGLAQFDLGSPAFPLTPSLATPSTIDEAIEPEVGILSLPRELRDKIYRYILVAGGPIVFHRKTYFERSAQLLGTCRIFAAEGAAVLYGENSFHFERTAERRGTYRDLIWKEVGYKDVRRFLQDIGTTNISYMKYVSFTFEDAAAYLTPYLNTQIERQFVHDPVLHEIFRMIGANTVLSKLALEFGGRAHVNSKDLHFLRALGQMTCHTFYHHKHRYNGGRIQDAALNTLKSVAVIKKKNARDIDEKKVKHVPMHLEKPKKENFSKAW